MDIMIPVWQQAAAHQPAAAGLAALKGATVAIVDDGFDMPFTKRLEALLRDVHGAVVEAFVKPLGSAPSPKSLLDQAAKSRVAIVGIGL
jgi:hypothetical protein